MLFKLTLIAGLTASAVVAISIPDPRPFTCGVKANKELLDVHRKLAGIEAEARVKGVNKRDGITVDLYIHIVSATQSGANSITSSTVQKQVDVLNDNYGPSGISFTLQTWDRTVNSDWATNGNELNMKKKLRKGGSGSLNLYFLDRLTKNNYGICTFPHQLSDEDGKILDGCLVKAATMPGGGEKNFNQGKTATHEAGHWFGLLHTFENHKGNLKDSACGGPGDYVDDTPESSTPSEGCPKGRDSCPAPGLDPIHNYMDYSYDSCYEEFTSGQADRMNSLWYKFRA